MSTFDDIRRAQMIAGENAVIADLRRKGLVPQAPLSETDSLRKDAERYRWLIAHWYDHHEGARVHRWIADNSLRCGGIESAIDHLMQITSTARPSPSEPT